MEKILAQTVNYKYRSDDRQHLVGMVIAFLVWPFGAFLYALYTYRRKESHLIMILFTGLYAYSMLAESAGLDLYRVLESAKKYADLSFDQVWAVINGLYGSTEDAGVDIYRDLVAFIVTRFSSNGHLMMMVFGLIYGWFYVKSLQALLSVNSIKNRYSIILLFSFSMIFSMDQIAGIRFATAAYLMFFGLFRYFQTKEYKFIIVAGLACLIHFSFIAVILTFVIYILLKPGNKVLYILVLITFFAGQYLSKPVINLINMFEGSIQSRTNLYIQLETSIQNLIWYVNYREEMMTIYMILFILFTKIRKVKLIETDIQNQLFGFSLMLLSLANITTDIPHAGSRFSFVAIMFFMAYIYVLYRNNYNNTTVKTLSLWAGPFFFLQIIYALRSIVFYSPYTLFLGFSPTVFFLKVDQSLWQLIQKLFT